METNESVIAKIQKLINLQEGAEAVGSIHEAENAAMRVQEYLLKYNLSISDVKTAKIAEKAKIGVTNFDLNPHQAKTEANWVRNLFWAISKYYLCKALHNAYTPGYFGKYDQGTMRIIGEENNVAIVMYTVEQLLSKIHISEKLSWKSYHGYEKRNAFKRGFLIGAVNGIEKKLEDQQRKMVEENNSMALMVITKKKELSEYVNTHFRVKSTSSNSRLSGIDGKTRGYEAGYNMNINKGMGNSSPKGNLN